MDKYDIAIIGSGLNALSIAADAASRGFLVALIDPPNLLPHKGINLPIVASGFMTTKVFDPSQLLANLSEVRTLARRSPDVCRWIPGVTCGKFDANRTLKSRLSHLLYRQMFQRFQLPKMTMPEGSHMDCIINTDILTERTRHLAQSFGARIETKTGIQSITHKQKDWRIDFNSLHGFPGSILATAVINCTGKKVPDISQHWFGYKSRCEVRTQWHSYINYSPDTVVNTIHYLEDESGTQYIYLPLSPSHVLIATSSAEITENRMEKDKLFEKIQRLLHHYQLPRITRENCSDQLIIPVERYTSDDALGSKGYLIDLLCPEGVRPLVNILGGHCCSTRLTAEHAINSLTDYLPKRGACQTGRLPFSS